MKNHAPRFRAFVSARLSVIVTVAILAGAFVAASAVTKSGNKRKVRVSSLSSRLPGGGGQQPPNGTAGKPLSVNEEVGEVPVQALPKVAPAVFGGDVRDLPQVPQRDWEGVELEEPVNLKQFLPEARGPSREEPNIPVASMPGPIQNFPGLTRTDSCVGGQCGAGTPPDTNGDVGPNHYIQAVNSAYAIYDKTNGNLLASFTENSLFSGGPTGTICDTSSFGDPIVVYDPMADRWILSNFAFNVVSGNPVAPYYQCIAASRTGNPVTGGWNLYGVRTDTGAAGQPPVNTLNDYGKFGIWSDCLYFSANGFINNGASYGGPEFATFSRSDMYAGLALTSALGYFASGTVFTMIPSNLSAPGASGLPPANTPNYFVSESATLFAYEVRKFTAGANCGGGGSLGAAATVSQTSYSGSAGSIVPQPPPATASNNLDSLIDRLMQKVQYRRVGGTESLWVVHSVRPTTSSTVQPQWAQINVTGGTVVSPPVQQQIYAPDATLHRWMGSIAADKDGNVALGYSTSNATSPNFPSVAYSGRLATDTLNMLPQTETQLVAGGGSQVHLCGGGPCHRWGDYSAMSVDPADLCTFWYTTEYYVNQTGGNSGAWNTRIGSFKFPSCVGVVTTPTNTPTPTRTNTPTNTPTRTNTPVNTPTSTPTNTPTSTPTRTSTPSNTPSNTPTITATNTPTRTNTPTPSNTPSNTPTITATNTPTRTNTPTPSSTPANTPTNTSVPATDTPTNTPTSTPTPSNTPTQTSTPSNTPTPTPSQTSTPSNTPSNTPSDTPTGTPVPATSTPTISPTNTPTPTNTPSNTPSSTPSDTPTNTPVPATSTPTNTPAAPTITPTSTRTPTPTRTVTNTRTVTPTRTPTRTATNTRTVTPTRTATNTRTSTPTRTPTRTPTGAFSPTLTPTATITPTSTITPTPTQTPTPGASGIAFVKNVGTASHGSGFFTSLQVAVPPAGVAAGHSLIIAIYASSNTVTFACTDSKSNVYSQDVAAGGGGVPRSAVVSSHNVTALVSGDTITCTFPNSSTTSGMSVNEFSGLSPAPLDKTAAGAATTGTVDSGLTLATTQTNELVFGFVHAVSFTPAASGSNPFEVYADPPNSDPFHTAGQVGSVWPVYRVVSTIRQYQTNGTGGGSGGWRAMIATYKGF